MNIIHFFKRHTLFLILLVVSFNVFAFDEKGFEADITHTKEMFAQGKHDAAIEYWENKRSTYGGQEGHYEYELAVFYSRVKAFDRAEKTYVEGIQLENKYPRLYIGLSYVYLWTGRYDESSAVLDTTINEYPDWWLGYYTKAHHEYLTENYETAKTFSELSLSKTTNAKGFFMLARSCFELNEFRTVITAIEDAINIEPNYLGDLSTMKMYAVSLAGEGLHKEAIAVIEEVKKHNEKAVEDEELKKLLEEIEKPNKNQ
jgi:tetratricopeptide (TPR) repeat protein